MHPEFNLAEIALVALAALGCGVVFERFKQPAVLGYILAGVILGPSLFGIVENRDNVALLAELGVLMLLFVIGLELNLDDFKRTWHVSLMCTLMQIGGAFVAVFSVTYVLGLPFSLGVLAAFAVALSSTAVAVKMLDGLGELKTETGRLTIGILIAQDLAVVPMILIVRNLNAPSLDLSAVTMIVLSLVILAGVIFLLGKGKKMELPFSSIVYAKPDLVPLVILGFCLGLAALTGFIGLSAAYGAFLAGLVLGNTADHDKLMEAALPLQSILMMVFFLSVGLLLDLAFVWHNLLTVLLLIIIIAFVKSVMNVGILHTLGQPWQRSFLAGLILAQMGEFAFVLITVGSEAKVIDAEGQKLIISLAALSLAFSPFWLAGVRRIQKARKKDVESLTQAMDTAFGNEVKVLSTASIAVVQKCKEGLQKISGDKDQDSDEKS